MNEPIRERVHECLEGEIPRCTLSCEELLQLEQIEEAVEEVREHLYAVPVPDFTRSVMTALPGGEPAPGWTERLHLQIQQFLASLWAPRTIQIRPALALGFAMGLLLLVQVAPRSRTDAPAAGPAPVLVQFRLDAEGASSVALAGTFNDWQPVHELRESAPGVWTVFVPVEPGVHDYLFMVDGTEWVSDPAAQTVDDSFGGTNSRLYLTHAL